MTVELQESQGKIARVRISGKLSKQDYERLTPHIDAMIAQHGKIRILMEMHDFHGWELGALWEDMKFDLKHFKDIERLAMIGEKRWQEGMSKFCRPFTTAKIRYFEKGSENEALAWLEEA